MTEPILPNSLLKSAASGPNHESSKLASILMLQGLRYYIRDNHPEFFDPLHPSFKEPLHNLIKQLDSKGTVLEPNPDITSLLKAILPYLNPEDLIIPSSVHPSSIPSKTTIPFTHREASCLLNLAQLAQCLLTSIFYSGNPTLIKHNLAQLNPGVLSYLTNVAKAMSSLLPKDENTTKDENIEIIWGMMVADLNEIIKKTRKFMPPDSTVGITARFDNEDETPH